MDIRRKLGITLAAMVLAGQLGASLPVAAASRTQLVTLQSYLVADDLAGLARYIEANPSLLDASSPLSIVLAEFLLAFRGNARLVAFPTVPVEQVRDDLVVAVKAAMY